MTWRSWTATIVIALVAAAGWWFAREAFSPPEPRLGEIITIAPAPTSSPPPSHHTTDTDGATEAPLVPPPAAGEDDSDDGGTDLGDTDVDTDLDEVDGP